MLRPRFLRSIFPVVASLWTLVVRRKLWWYCSVLLFGPSNLPSRFLPGLCALANPLETLSNIKRSSSQNYHFADTLGTVRGRI